MDCACSWVLKTVVVLGDTTSGQRKVKTMNISVLSYCSLHTYVRHINAGRQLGSEMKLNGNVRIRK